MNTTYEKADKLAFATYNLVQAVREFRDAQHGVIFQIQNPSLSFEYEFAKSGKRLEAARVALYNAMEEAQSCEIDWAVSARKKKRGLD